MKAFVAYGFEPEADENVSIEGCGEVPVLSWKALLQLGDEKGSGWAQLGAALGWYS